MTRISYLTIASASALALTACGGGGGSTNAPISAPPVSVVNTVPSSATASVEGLMTYMKASTQMLDDNATVVDIADALLPVREDTEPDASI